MFEFILIIGAAIAIYRVAEADSNSGLKWAGIMFGAGLLSILIPIPYLRVIVAIGAVFVAMTMTKKTYY